MPPLYKAPKKIDAYAQEWLSPLKRASAVWLNPDWGHTHLKVEEVVHAAADAGETAQFVIKSLPVSFNNFNEQAWQEWVYSVCFAMMGSDAIVVLEPDFLVKNDTPTIMARRMHLLRTMVFIFRQSGTYIYIDAGQSQYHSVNEIARRLVDADVARATGFALNTANFQPLTAEVPYATAIQQALAATYNIHGVRAVVDTSRNGGANVPVVGNYQNPTEMRKGEAPLVLSGHEVLDALIWAKSPGESDGTGQVANNVHPIPAGDFSLKLSAHLLGITLDGNGNPMGSGPDGDYGNESGSHGTGGGNSGGGDQ